MSRRQLRISPELALPLDVAGEATALLAKRGAGKTNTAKVLVEEVLDAGGVQVVALDPVGVWWALRAGADGKPGGGYALAVFGGIHGDLPLEPTAGKLLAETAVESGQSMVLDVSGLDTDGAMQRFVFEFAERLYTLKQRTPTPLLLVLEEADEFAPQDTRGKNVPRMVGAIARIVKRGRSRGIGIVSVTQRSAALNKNVLDQADTLIVMQTIGPRDRKAIEGWVAHQQAEGMSDVIPSLPNLQRGEAWFWSPGRQLLERVNVRKARTFDSSETPKAGATARVAKVKPIDVDALGEKIRATVERVKENDPAELRKTVAQLRRELAAHPTETKVETIVERVEVSVLAVADREALRTVAGKLGSIAAGAAEASQTLTDLLVDLEQRTNGKEAHGTTRTQPKPRPPARAVPRVPELDRASKRRDDLPAREARGALPGSAPTSDLDDDFDVRLSRSQQTILDALAALEAIGVARASKTQVALFAKASPKSSTYTNNLGALKNDKGVHPWPPLIDYPAAGWVALTSEGRAFAHADAAPATTEELHAEVEKLVGAAKWKLLEQLIAYYDAPLEKAELAEFAGYSATSSTYTNMLGALRSLGLIDYPAPGMVVALPILFLEGA